MLPDMYRHTYAYMCVHKYVCMYVSCIYRKGERVIWYSRVTLYDFKSLPSMVAAGLLQASGALDTTNCSSDNRLEGCPGSLRLEHTGVLFGNKALGHHPVK